MTTERHEELLPDPLPESPLPTLARWLEEARASEAIRNPDALALATVDEEGLPRVRMVLCRRFDAEAGSFSFYTNRESPKARELERLGHASGVFYWDALGRQARIRGPVMRTSDADSDDYFASRHPRSQVAAWVSRQSQPIASRAALLERFEREAGRLGFPDSGRAIPRPPHWGGYRIEAEEIELWLEGADRLHDRARWSRRPRSAVGPSGVGPLTGNREPAPAAWIGQRLQP
jgi:pyridoxamine 5'-phosphate oxidase